MLLSNYLLSGGVKPYLEYAWVCAPNTAKQVITANTIQALTIDTEVADTGNNGSISGNQITLNSGTYYFEASTCGYETATTNFMQVILGLYNTSGSYVTRRLGNQGNISYAIDATINGQFTISATSTFELRILSYFGITIGTLTNSTLTTANADQRTTIKLWKLA
jgi:hypothetical protein